LTFFQINEKIENKKQKIRTTIECQICGNYNLPENDICFKCGKALSLKAITRAEKQKHVLEDVFKELKIQVLSE